LEIINITHLSSYHPSLIHSLQELHSEQIDGAITAQSKLDAMLTELKQYLRPQELIPWFLVVTKG